MKKWRDSMGDLISRKAVETAIKNYFSGLIDKCTYDIDVVNCAAGVNKAIDEIRDAYDVDKLVKILDKDAQMLYSMGNFKPIKVWENKYLIPVIKAGGSKTWVDILQKGAVKDEKNQNND
jgi:hypothetical protein